MRPGSMMRLWRLLLTEIGGFGVFFTTAIGLPMGIVYIHADPSNPKRWWYGALFFCFCILMCRAFHKDSVKAQGRKDALEARRALALSCVRRMRELPKMQRCLRDVDLDVLEAGLQEPRS